VRRVGLVSISVTSHSVGTGGRMRAYGKSVAPSLQYALMIPVFKQLRALGLVMLWLSLRGDPPD